METNNPTNRGLLGRFGIKNPINRELLGSLFLKKTRSTGQTKIHAEKPGRDLLRTKLGVCKGPRPTKLEARTEGCKNPSLQKDHLEFCWDDVTTRRDKVNFWCLSLGADSVIGV